MTLISFAHPNPLCLDQIGLGNLGSSLINVGVLSMLDYDQ